MYIVNHNRCGYLPDCEPQEFSNLRDAKQAVSELKRELQETLADYELTPHFQKWENISYLTAQDIKHFGSFTIGIVWADVPRGTIEHAIFIAWSNE